METVRNFIRLGSKITADGDCSHESKRESEKAGLKLNIQKMKIMASGPTTSQQIDGKQ